MHPIDGKVVAAALEHVAIEIEANKDYLCELDGEVGDGDHGVSMTIGMRAVRRALRELPDPTPEQTFQAAADAFADEVGATTGPLYEAAFEAAARTAAGKLTLDRADDWAAIYEAMATAIQQLGKAQVGDKTLLDALIPAAQAIRHAADSGADLPTALRAASQAAHAGAEHTKQLLPKLGRASRLGERARGYQDAGATSAYLILEAFEQALVSSVPSSA